jgi:DNA-binding NarL/FixJ family response regulator
LQVVGEAAYGQQLLEQLPTTPTDVVLLDLHMPVLDGLATARELYAHYPAIRVLMLSMVEEPLSVGQALAAGAHGYILKNADKNEILTGIQVLLSGKRFLCSEIGLTLLDIVLAPEAEVPMPTPASLLSRREREVLQLVSEGLTTQQIADQLFTSKRTIETHRQNMLEKTCCKNTATLIRWALAQQVLPEQKPASQ